MQRDKIFDKQEPFFSIVIASYNVRHELEMCIDSIQRQSFLNYELLISDGGSVDGTRELISSGEITGLAWYKSAPDKGIYDALNLAIDHVSGKWVLVLGADDRLADSDALLRAYTNMNRLNLNIGIIYSDLYINRDNSVLLKKYPEFDEFERRYKGGAFIHHQTAFVLRDAIVNVEKFSSKYKIHSDYDLMLKVAKTAGAVKIDGAFVVFCSSGFSSKLSNLWLSFREIYIIRKSHGYFPVPFRLLLSYGSLLARRLFPFLRI